MEFCLRASYSFRAGLGNRDLILQVVVFKDDMAQTFHRQPITAEVEASTVRGLLSDHRSLALRRLLAWGLEVSFLVGSICPPLGIGEAVRQRSEQELVPLNPVTGAVQDAIAPYPRPAQAPSGHRSTAHD